MCQHFLSTHPQKKSVCASHSSTQWMLYNECCLMNVVQMDVVRMDVVRMDVVRMEKQWMPTYWITVVLCQPIHRLGLPKKCLFSLSKNNIGWKYPKNI